jgi:hypothetical protein
MTLTIVDKAVLALVVVGTLAATLAFTVPITLKADPIRAGDRCYRCQRLITDRSLAAEGIGAPGVGVRKFRTVACMLKYLNESNENLDVLVTDSPSGRFTQPQWASFVRTTIDMRTGEEDYVAFREPWSARRFADKQSTTPMDWETVQALDRVHPLAH